METKCKKPKKQIEMYFLGNVAPIANFYDNTNVAVFCLQQLNNKVVADSGMPVNRQTLLQQKFYFLTGNDDSRFVHYVDTAGVDLAPLHEKFMRKIMAVDAHKAYAESQLLPMPENDTKVNYPGGRKNKKNRGA